MYEYKNELRIYLTLYFDNDTEMELVRQCIGISEATIVNRCDRRKNPFDESKNLPGFWQVMYSGQNLSELSVATNGLLKLISPKLEVIVQVMERFNGQAELLVVCDLDNDYPALTFDYDFVHVANTLHAGIDVDIQADLANVEYCSD